MNTTLTRSFSIAATAFTLAACSDMATALRRAAPPPLPDGAQALTPPTSYAQWWRDTEQCAGRTGEMSRIHWFSIPDRTSFMYLDGQYDGYWWNDVHWIILAGDKVQDAMIVRHEMLHDLLGRGDHPAAYFQERCAGVVACNDVCRADE